ncbi:16S rRNA (cytosine(967)-C(5))-methyltransferase RsmB [Agaribacter flavus]|uniref:16S rRNA (cytosine(967)-C(5))-methyltransferase n=1 Tax=Agaribacter flavus TaxID=1902781 RepID=A0ABV7FNX1_9ALTE
MPALNSQQRISHKIDLRADAAWALFEVLENGRSSRDIMPMIFARYNKSQDKAWIQEVIYGCLRVLPKLQFWTHSLLEKPLKGKQKIIEHVIMLGLFQIHSMRTSDHAAVSETVNAAKVLGQPKFAGLVNAILRNFTRKKIAELPFPQPHIAYDLPKWLFKQLQADYPESWQDIAQQSNKKAPLWLRVNQQKISVGSFCQALEQAGIDYECVTNTAIKVLSQASVPALPGYEQGWFNVQDYAAQQCTHLLDVNAGELILDCCAAPGGKTLALYDSCPELGTIYAVDKVNKRLDTMRENLERAHLKGLQRIKLLEADACALTEIEALPMFDKILLDAPCSATGIIRRHPDIKWLRKRQDIEVLVALQSDILEQAWAKLKPGGTLLYATCSILKVENTLQIEQFLNTHKDAQLSPISHALSCEGQSYGWQILPGEQEMDGFFYARLIKSK